jgi:hypothetical protein
LLDKRVLQEITTSRKTAPAIEIDCGHPEEGKSPGAGVGAVADLAGSAWWTLVGRVVQNGRMTQKRQCHARVSGHPDLAAGTGALDSRLRKNNRKLMRIHLPYSFKHLIS